MLLTPPDQYVCWQQPPHPGATCEFTWSWDGVLKPSEYFQLQLIGPNGEHWGVHAPTKDPFYTYTYDRWQHWGVADWCSGFGACHLLWTVIVVEWDGVDTAKLVGLGRGCGLDTSLSSRLANRTRRNRIAGT